MKILVVTPRFPFAARGACEQDRSYGIKRLVEMGHDVQVITKCIPSDVKKVAAAETWTGAQITPVLYTKNQPLSSQHRRIRLLRRLVNPLYWDGAAYEYTDPLIQEELLRALDAFAPDRVWFDYTYLWPLYRHVQQRNIPIITRSINFEADHFLQEDGASLINYIKYVPKVLSEIITARKSSIVLAITPKEEKTYRQVGAKKVSTLPLRRLPQFLPVTYTLREIEPLNLIFMGSTYGVSHNREALRMVVEDIAPQIQTHDPNGFMIHVVGGKTPEDIQANAGPNVTIHGFVDDLEVLLQTIDIALVPSLYGCGMQQKVFEPLARGIPTITSARVLADYPFQPDRDVLVASTTEEFVNHILSLKDQTKRLDLSRNAKAVSQKQFTQAAIDAVVVDALSA